jgi:hypothetical protein
METWTRYSYVLASFGFFAFRLARDLPFMVGRDVILWHGWARVPLDCVGLRWTTLNLTATPACRVCYLSV